ncbi:MAG: hotdog fold thioesterase [Bacteroidota bacterium]
MSIWFQQNSLADVQRRGAGTMVEYIGIEITEVGVNYLKGRMPVDYRTIQPMGILHGGASVALAETLGSIAANLVVDPTKYYCVGLDINANHIRKAAAGFVYGTATPLHIGKTTQVWSIEIRTEEEKLVCISRLTMAVLER